MLDLRTDDKLFAFYKKRKPTNIIDPHDLFHWRANIVILQEIRNHYMVCGAGYVYGGSWGMSWDDIQQMFKTRMSYDKKTDWLKLYFERYNFGESWEEHLLITQFINALIIEKTEREKGFAAVMELLSSGNIYRQRDQFFAVLEKVTGINERNFNKKVSKLIDDAMKKRIYNRK